FNQDVAFFAMVTASKHQRRTSGIWWADSVPELKLKFYAQVTQIPVGTGNTAVFTSIGGPEADAYGWLTEYNSSSIEKSEDYCFPGLPCFLDGYTINSYWGEHQGKCDDDQWRSCNNTW
ncbi:MAG: hypothetical protein LH606_00005, partial [Cytophagaceae bacterium]|nr:hypothetical protein [Cytophagaceae bacterium]